MSAFSRFVDLLQQRGKDAAKNVYRGPVIAAAGVWKRAALRGACCIGVTGTAGKTTTKELLHAILTDHARSVKNHDSNNQLYSIARTLICAPPWTRYVVQEVGASQPGAFDPMLALLRPQVGVVTNVGTEHFKEFRTPEAVAAEKGKLIRALPAHGIAVLNADDERVRAMSQDCRARIVTFGTGPDAHLRVSLHRSAWPDWLSMTVYWKESSAEVRTRMQGSHQSVPVMAALAAACALGVPLAQACAAVGKVEPLLGRMSVQTTSGGIHFVRDDWKAPAWSMPLVMDYLAQSRARRKVLVIGTISDYGGASRVVYRRVIEAALEAADHVVVVGDRGPSVNERLGPRAPGRVHGFVDIAAASAWLRNFLAPDDLVLLKGSNPADHLARLALAFDTEVRCWRRRCGRLQFCDNCRLLSERAP